MEYHLVADGERQHIDVMDGDDVVGTMGFSVVDGEVSVERLWVSPAFEKQGWGAGLIVQTLTTNNITPRPYWTDQDLHMEGLHSVGLTVDGMAFVESVIGPLGYTKEVA